MGQYQNLRSRIGIGLAVANYLLRTSEKHNLVVLGRNQECLDKLKSQRPDQVVTLAGDFSDLSLGGRAVELAISSFGRLDALVVNHGTLGKVSKIADCEISDFQTTMDVNFVGAVAIVSHMPLRGAGIPGLKQNR